jgi:hypothetical protein
LEISSATGHLGELGVGVVRGPVLEGQLLRLDHQVERRGRLRAHALQVVGLQQVEHLEDGDPLAVGGQLPDVVAAVVGGDGLDPGAGMLPEVPLREEPADFRE